MPSVFSSFSLSVSFCPFPLSPMSQSSLIPSAMRSRGVQRKRARERKRKRKCNLRTKLDPGRRRSDVAGRGRVGEQSARPLQLLRRAVRRRRRCASTAGGGEERRERGSHDGVAHGFVAKKKKRTRRGQEEDKKKTKPMLSNRIDLSLPKTCQKKNLKKTSTVLDLFCSSFST
jgi:hypothetical protein